MGGLKKKLGLLKRGLFGFWHNTFESVPKIPKNSKTFSLGVSVLGNEILCHQIGSGPTALLFAVIHGNEVGAFKAALHLHKYLRKYFSNYPGFTFYLIPILNVDGFIEAVKNPDYLGGGKIGRFNANGVDLNRNFPTKSFQPYSTWGFGKDYGEKQKVFCGNAGASEPEMQALLKLIGEKNIKLLFMFHNAAADVMANALPKAQKLASAFADASGYRYVPAEEWEILQQTGTAREWCDEQSMLYIEAEGRWRWGSDWKNQKKGVQAVLAALS